MRKTSFGVLIGNRDFFPDVLIGEGRRDILSVLNELDIQPVILDETDTKLGAVETYNDAKKCADFFKQHRDAIAGILVILPNFGDEKGVADTIKMAGLDVPILVQAYPDDLDRLNVERRRDAFCGKLSVCNNLYQYNFKYSLTTLHTIHPSDASFRNDVRQFVGVCRTVNQLRNARLGAIGARPNAFNTTRFSEKLLQASGISVGCISV
jgi:L-fucose isomerase-like protein